MALSFTTIPDYHGPAVYILHGGDSRTEQQALRLGEEIDARSNQQYQVVYLDPKRDDGLRVKEFYGLTDFPCVMVVLDDDSIPHQWTHTLPRADEVTYVLSHLTGAMHSS